MEDLSNEELLRVLGNFSVTQLIALTRELEGKWNLKAEPHIVSAPKETVVVAAQTEFNVMLISVPADKKMSVIKIIREIMALGLKESKEFVENAPKMVKEAVTSEEANAIKIRLTEAGAVIEVK